MIKYITRNVQGCRTLLLGDARTFFMLYRVVADAGLRAYQLDRDGALTRGGAPPAALAAAAAAAADAADCVLATYALVATAGFPLRAFHIIVEYECQAAGGVPEAAKAALAAVPCSRHVQLDMRLDWLCERRQQPHAAQEEGHAHEAASVVTPAQDAARGASPALPASPQSARLELPAPSGGAMQITCITS